MKVGDLVTLSSAGRKLKMFDWVTFDDAGLVIRVGYGSNPFIYIKWCKPSSTAQVTQHSRFLRKDIKYAK